MATSGSADGGNGYGSSHATVQWSRTSADVNANTSTIEARLYLVLGGGTSLSATESGYIRVNGGNNTFSRGSTARGPGGTYQVHSISGVVLGHDANGNCSFSIGGLFHSGFASMGDLPYVGDNGYALDRLALAPTISSLIADTITPVSARLGADLSSFGHGTSANWEMFYRKQGSGTWISLGVQANVGGYNYWNPTGLLPNSIYEYYSTCTNNNGDVATSSTQTFTTLSGVKVILSDGTVQNRVVKQILPSGVTTTRIVTKIT
jgi:hypothetical protein